MHSEIIFWQADGRRKTGEAATADSKLGASVFPDARSDSFSETKGPNARIREF